MLALERRATTLVMQTQFKSQKVVMLCKFLAVMTIFFSDMKINFWWILQQHVTDQRSIHHLAQSFDHLFPWVKIRFQNRITSSELNPVQSSISYWLQVQEMGVCSDSNRLEQPLQMAESKTWKFMCWPGTIMETMSGMILNQFQPRLAAKSVANEMRCLKAM